MANVPVPFANVQIVELIKEAYERCGIVVNELTALQIDSAERGLNLVLKHWANKGLNLFSVKYDMLDLSYGQSTYELPEDCIDLLEVTARQVIRLLGGLPYSSAGGNAFNAFDNNISGACIQTSPNGYISYDYGLGQLRAVELVGVQSNAVINYTLVYEYSLDNITWFSAGESPTQTYYPFINVWNVIVAPVNARYFRVRETGGATLNIQQLYFSAPIYDRILSRLSRSEYTALPNKNQIGVPSSFFINRIVNPAVTLWPAPDQTYTQLYFNYNRQIPDVLSLSSISNVPPRFFEALCSALAVNLAVKMVPERIDMLMPQAAKAFSEAAREDHERVPVSFYPSLSGVLR